MHAAPADSVVADHASQHTACGLLSALAVRDCILCSRFFFMPSLRSRPPDVDPVQAAPGADEDASSKLWLYRSVLTQQTDANSGLVGPIIVSRPGVADADGSPSDVDVEFVTLYQVSSMAASQGGVQECSIRSKPEAVTAPSQNEPTALLMWLPERCCHGTRSHVCLHASRAIWSLEVFGWQQPPCRAAFCSHAVCQASISRIFRKSGQIAAPRPLLACCSQVFDESNSPFTAANEALFAGNAPNGGLNDYDFTDFLLHHAINGKMYCSLTGLTAAVGDRVRWHIATLVRFTSSQIPPRSATACRSWKACTRLRHVGCTDDHGPSSNASIERAQRLAKGCVPLAQTLSMPQTCTMV